jgi:hypothetical protein
MIWERDLPQGSIIRPSGHTPRINARANTKRSGAAQALPERGTASYLPLVIGYSLLDIGYSFEFRHFYAVLAGLDPAMGGGQTLCIKTESCDETRDSSFQSRIVTCRRGASSGRQVTRRE